MGVANNLKLSKMAARTVMQAHAFEPIEELIQLFHDPLCPLEEKIGIAKSLAPYAHPKLAHVTMAREDEGDVSAAMELARRIAANPRAAELVDRLMRELKAADEANTINIPQVPLLHAAVEVPAGGISNPPSEDPGCRGADPNLGGSAPAQSRSTGVLPEELRPNPGMSIAGGAAWG